MCKANNFAAATEMSNINLTNPQYYTTNGQGTSFHIR